MFTDHPVGGMRVNVLHAAGNSLATRCHPSHPARMFVPAAQDHRDESGVLGPSPRGGARVTLSATFGEGGAR